MESPNVLSPFEAARKPLACTQRIGFSANMIYPPSEFEMFEARELERENAEDEDELEEALNTLLNLPKSDSSEDTECKENR